MTHYAMQKKDALMINLDQQELVAAVDFVEILNGRKVDSVKEESILQRFLDRPLAVEQNLLLADRNKWPKALIGQCK